MRYLFVLPYPGFLRYFDSVVQELAARGHHVDLVWEKIEKQHEGLAALLPHPAIRSHQLPKRKDRWRRPATRVRNLAKYARYLDRRFADAVYLRRRAGIGVVWPFNRLRTLPDWLVWPLIDLFSGIERAIPRSAAIDRFIERCAPDAVILGPLVYGTRQGDVLASARAKRLPTAAAIASWDNLTTKSILLAHPDRMLVWNETQRREAGEFHRYPPQRVVVTGAQCFDRWFNRQPSRSRDGFCAAVGLPPERQLLLYVGSTASIISPDAEVQFVRQWIQFLASDSDLAEFSLLLRPHPYNDAHWRDVELAEFPNVRVWPRSRPNPVDESSRADYFDSLYYAAAVIGINTSAMVEAAIVGRPVLCLGADELHEAQRETLHFQYLLPENGGFVQAAHSFEEHAAQLKHALATPAAVQAAATAFVESFIRPAGLSRPATPIVVQALEELAQTRPEPVAAIPRRIVALRLVLMLFALPELPDQVRKIARRRRKRARKLARQWRKRARAAKARTVS
jgi:hypothetical protein